MGLKKNLNLNFSNRPNENLIHSDGVGVMPILSSSDSEEEDASSGRYTALPQDLGDNNIQEEDSDSQESSEDEVACNVEEPSSSQSANFEITVLWNSGNNRLTNIDMDSTKVEQIKNAMAGFKLPSTSIPSWAEHIPEEEWKQEIINKVYLLNKESKS